MAGFPSREDIVQKLYSAVLSDTLDGLGFMNQAMKPFVRPLDESIVMFGRARTGLYMDSYVEPRDRNPYALEIALVDDLQPADVAVLGCRGPTDRIAPWGELLSTAAMCRKAAGCVTDGLVRDINRIREMRFPVFHGGIGPLDSKGRGEMKEMDTPIDCAGVRVASGDYILGDCDGVVVLPAEVAEEALRKALEKVTAEDRTRQELLQGRSLKEVYDTYGVL
jgi:4-hydroxy-4-methyl-2-oxoglutarate aldolase